MRAGKAPPEAPTARSGNRSKARRPPACAKRPAAPAERSPQRPPASPTQAPAAETVPRRWVREDFNRPTLRVARDLLGKFIVHDIAGTRFAAMIAETEAYKGPRDRASHAAGGRRTRRVEPLYGAGGTVYVYFVYGMHWMLNFSTAGEGRPEGVLIRAIVVGPPGHRSLLSGPGRVTRHLHIDGRQDRVDAVTSRALWIEDRGVRIARRAVMCGPRVGVDYAGPYWAARPWRFRFDMQAISRER